MGAEDHTLETEIESRIQEGKGFTYFNLMKAANEVCQCLLKIHTNHIAHLDLKPANVLYSQKIDKWIVIDCGLSEDHEEDLRLPAKSIDNCSFSSYGCTPSYASPLARKSKDMP